MIDSRASRAPADRIGTDRSEELFVSTHIATLIHSTTRGMSASRKIGGEQ